MRQVVHHPVLSPLAVLAVAVALMVPAPAALAYFVCSYTVTVYARGGQSCSTTCHFYDNETGAYQGHITREYRLATSG